MSPRNYRFKGSTAILDEVYSSSKARMTYHVTYILNSTFRMSEHHIDYFNG